MTGNDSERSERARLLGPLCGLGAAVSFGLAAPLSKLLLRDMSALLLAGVLYLGASLGLGLFQWGRRSRREARLQRNDLWKLALVSISGGIVGPVLMLMGVERLPALAASLLLNLEAPFTIALSLVLFSEHLSRRAAAGSVLIVLGSAALQWQGLGTSYDGVGVLCLVLACACWALDNNLTQRLSLKDPFAIVRAKALTAGLFNTGLSWLLGQAVHVSLTQLGAALLLGSISYGVSVVLDAYALRFVGAAREAAYFATAPFVGALLAVLLLHEPLQIRDVTAGLIMAAGVLCLLYERHSHSHAHHAQYHDHLHVHDAHHQHEHAADVALDEPHAHPHQHADLVHDHPHVSDAHHRHKH